MGKPSGLTSIDWSGGKLNLRTIERLGSAAEILNWVLVESGRGNAVVAVDAPLVIANPRGIRPAERELNRDFLRFHAGCLPANLGRPFATHVVGFSRRLK